MGCAQVEEDIAVSVRVVWQEYFANSSSQIPEIDFMAGMAQDRLFGHRGHAESTPLSFLVVVLLSCDNVPR